MAATPSRNPQQLVPNFWAGGHQWGQTSRKEEFIAGNFWEHGYDEDAEDAPSRTTWERFRQIKVGDWFAIKGYGGTNKLRIWYVGRVSAKDEDNARLELEPLKSPSLFRDTAPPGLKWFDALVPCTQPQVIHAIFRDYFESDYSFERVASRAPMPTPIPNPNTIFYGPPGTGKTYRARELMDAYRGKEPSATQGATIPNVPGLDTLRWFEVIALAMHTLGRPASVPELQEHPYIVHRHSQRNVATALNKMLWRNLQEHTVENSKTVHAANRSPPFLFDKDNEKRWFLANGLPDDLADILPKKKAISAEFRQENFLFTTFHQSFSYEDFVEGIRPSLGDEDEAGTLNYVLMDGIFKQAALRAILLTDFRGTLAQFCGLSPQQREKHLKDAPRFALFIDEVNRGNVSRVFGELITLIEPDKRLGAERELIVTLPNSRQRFGVPSNLDIIATMNSADRSVEALDTALRRRFAFVEVRPRPELLDFEFEGGVRASELLRAMNHRIHRLLDRDHQIGHAYFLDCKARPTLAELRQLFALRVLPLLQEYFFGEWAKIGLVLGSRWVRPLKAAAAAFAKFQDETAGDYEDRIVYEVTDPNTCKAEDFRAIYE